MKQTHLLKTIKGIIKSIPLFLLIFLFQNTSLRAQSCNDLSISGSNGQIAINGLTAPIEIVDVYDANWSRIFRCQGGDCGSQQTIPNLGQGLYHVNIQMYTAGWQSICSTSEDIQVSGGATGDGQVDLTLSNLRNFPASGAPGEILTFNFDLNNFGNQTAAGAYRINAYLSTQSYFNVNGTAIKVGEINTGNTPVGTISDVTGAITIPSGQSPGDYYFFLEADVDNVIPETNNNNNGLVSILKVQEGGDSGNTIQCGEITINYGNGSIQMQGQAGKQYNFKIHDLNAGWAEAYSCAFSCGSSQTANNLGNGRYMVRVYNNSWSLICEREVDLSGVDQTCGFDIQVSNRKCFKQNGKRYVEFDLTAAGSGPGGRWKTITGPSASGAYNETVHVGPFEWLSGQLILNFSVSDVQDPSCNKNYSSDLPSDCNCTLLGNGCEPSGTDCPAVPGPENNPFRYEFNLGTDDRTASMTKMESSSGNLIWYNPYLLNINNALNYVFSSSIKEFSDHILLGILAITNQGEPLYVLIKTDLNGQQIWQKVTYLSEQYEGMQILDEASNGGYYINLTQGNNKDVILKTDSQGNQQWLEIIIGDLIANDFIYLGEAPNNGGIYVRTYIDSYGAIIEKINATNGNQLWLQNMRDVFQQGNTNQLYPQPQAVIASDGGIVGAYSWRFATTDYREIDGFVYGKLDANGNKVWSYNLPSDVFSFDNSPDLLTINGAYYFNAIGAGGDNRLYKINNNGTLSLCEGGGSNTISCGEITITSGTGTISMSGQSGKNYFFKIHDLNNNWVEAFNCSYNCGSFQSANNLSNGRYLVRVYNSSWNLICEQEINLGASSRSRLTQLETFTVYPNPAQEELYIDLKEFIGAQGEVVISNIYGKIMHQQTVESVSGDALRLSLSNFVNGVYYVQIKMPNRQLRSEKFLVKRLY